MSGIVRLQTVLALAAPNATKTSGIASDYHSSSRHGGTATAPLIASMNGMALLVCVVKNLHNSQEWLWMLISVHRIYISERIVPTYEFSYTGIMASM